MKRIFEILGEFIIILCLMKMSCNIYNYAILGNGIFIPIRLFGGFFILTLVTFSIILALE